MAKESSVAKAFKVEKLPESDLGHLVGGHQAAAEGIRDEGADGAGDGSLDLASEGGNEESTNDPENYDLGQCGEKFAGRQAIYNNGMQEIYRFSPH